MSLQVRHFLLAPDGIREFSTEQAAMIAAGSDLIPEFAGRNLRYLQLTVDENDDDGELKVQTAGAQIKFDNDGRLTEAAPPAAENPISRFEHDAVVEWALKNVPTIAPTFH
jgi:hypothetical protein